MLCRHTYSSWTEEGRKHASVCDKCGVAFSEFHKWDDGVIVKDYTETEKGEKLFTCTVCGATKTETFDAKLRYVFRAENFHVPSTTGVDKIIEDPTAPNGMVAAYSYADRLLAGQKNAADLYRINNQRLKLYAASGVSVQIVNVQLLHRRAGRLQSEQKLQRRRVCHLQVQEHRDLPRCRYLLSVYV